MNFSPSGGLQGCSTRPFSRSSTYGPSSCNHEQALKKRPSYSTSRDGLLVNLRASRRHSLHLQCRAWAPPARPGPARCSRRAAPRRRCQTYLCFVAGAGVCWCASEPRFVALTWCASSLAFGRSRPNRANLCRITHTTCTKGARGRHACLAPPDAEAHQPAERHARAPSASPSPAAGGSAPNASSAEGAQRLTLRELYCAVVAK